MVRAFPVRNYIDVRGSLGVIEGADLPFPVQRIYYLYDVPIGAVRGEHAHRKLEQLILCMHGRVEVTFNDGSSSQKFLLERPSQALHVRPGLWRSLRFLEAETIVCVLASRPYEPEDYIYTFEEYLRWVNAEKARRSPAPEVE